MQCTESKHLGIGIYYQRKRQQQGYKSNILDCNRVVIRVPEFRDPSRFFVRAAMKPHMHLVEVSIFHYIRSLSELPNLSTEPTKI